MFEPVRGGTRGGQAEFKWSDVSADKDRENYLGHSINAPTGRWQKNKDVHWYNRDINQAADERAEEIRKIKEAEADALAVALGFAPATKTTLTHGTAASESPTSPGTSQPPSAIPDAATAAAQRAAEKEEKRRRKAERKEEKRLKKELRRGEPPVENGDRNRAHGQQRLEGRRSRSRSPRREGYPYRHRSREPRDRFSPPRRLPEGPSRDPPYRHERSRSRSRDRNQHDSFDRELERERSYRR